MYFVVNHSKLVINENYFVDNRSKLKLVMYEDDYHEYYT